MNKKVKKFIAREGLVILSCVLIGFFIAYLGDYLNHYSKEMCDFLKGTKLENSPYRAPYPYMMFRRAYYLFVDQTHVFVPAGSKLYLGIEGIGLVTLLGFYPIYLLVRFIFWAVRTLREE